MDWSNIANNIYLWYNEFLEWYSEQPIYGQILALIGVFAVLAVIITLVYYLIKGIGYLIYYIIKGIYFLLKGIGFGFYKLCRGFYNLVSGKTKSKTQNESLLPPDEISKDQSLQPHSLIGAVQPNLMYCTECGNKFSEKMINNLKTNKITFCIHCGKRFELNEIPKHTILAY